MEKMQSMFFCIYIDNAIIIQKTRLFYKWIHFVSTSYMHSKLNHFCALSCQLDSKLFIFFNLHKIRREKLTHLGCQSSMAVSDIIFTCLTSDTVCVDRALCPLGCQRNHWPRTFGSSPRLGPRSGKRINICRWPNSQSSSRRDTAQCQTPWRYLPRLK